MSRLVIHIGDCKSGSTAIQSVLQTGSYQFENPEQKILYPDAGRRGALNHHRLSNSLFMRQAMQWQEKAWSALAEELATEKPDIAVISSERFEFAEPNSLQAALTKYFGAQQPDIHIVAYVRPHIERIVSGYAQNVKQGLYKDDISAFIEQMSREGRFTFAPRLTRWKSVFDHAQVTIRPMIRSELRNNCVVDDFLNLCVADSGTTASVTEIPYGNSSLSAPALELVRQLWGDAETMTDPQKNPCAAAIAKFARRLEDADPFKDQPSRLARADAERARDLYAEDARACDVKVFQRAVLGAALDNAIKKAPDTVAPPEVAAETIAVSTLWLETVEEILRNRAQQQKGRNPTTAQWRGTLN